MFKISKEFCEELGLEVWSVSRRDGQSFNGICAYNFSLADWSKAIECAQKLEALHS
jgi:hypothetical protein